MLRFASVAGVSLIAWGLGAGAASADFTVQTWDRIEVGPDVQDARWDVVFGPRFGALFGNEWNDDAFVGVGPTVSLRSTELRDLRASAGLSALLSDGSSGDAPAWQLRLDVEMGVSSAVDGPFVVATAEVGMGWPLRHHGIYRHRIGGGMMLSYLEYLEQDERQVVVGFSVQSLGALVAPLFIRP